MSQDRYLDIGTNVHHLRSQASYHLYRCIVPSAVISVVDDQLSPASICRLIAHHRRRVATPARFFGSRTGTPVPACSRNTQAGSGHAGIDAVIGLVEFLLVDADGQQLPSALWARYGVAGVLEHGRSSAMSTRGND